MSRKYKFHNPSATYFVSFATVYWIDIFTREIYFKVLVDSIGYCRAHKGMELFAYCFMPSHVHFIFRDANEEPSSLLRDFKKHTAKKILKAIKGNPQESKKEWLLWMFARAGKKKGNISNYQFWQHNNNPVAMGFVTEPTQWKYSSARNIAGEDLAFEIDANGFLE